MSPFAAPSLTPLPESPFLAELTSLATASSTVDPKAIADSIALLLKKLPGVLEATQKAEIIDVERQPVLSNIPDITRLAY
ncbi:hypothetical protein EHS25_003963 [Saitozyma podzolica]|uniref:Uncharacterized protein n=1 Tax=Saitozyma podzolica TaxID=1890683 RepID=A0A427YSR6_9TREE|nr:hypothetical protein EHS25_003963 [Saitozyma podzolica]